jgi:tetratricopeptide (TPR) repeat protein
LQELDIAQALSQETLALGEELQDECVKGDALNQLGIVAWQRGDLANARRYLLESLECFLAGGYSVMRAPVQMRLGAVLYAQGDHAAAQAYLWKSVAVCEEVGDKLRGGSALTQLGYVTMAQGNNLEAETILAKALLLIGETGHVFNRINPLNALGRLAQRQGDYARAHTLHVESLSLAEEMQFPPRLAHTLESFACLASRQGEMEMAARLFGATEMHVGASDRRLSANQVPFDPFWREEHEQLVAVARTALGEAAFAAAWAAGAAMTLDEAAALVEAQRQRVT